MPGLLLTGWQIRNLRKKRRLLKNYHQSQCITIPQSPQKKQLPRSSLKRSKWKSNLRKSNKKNQQCLRETLFQAPRNKPLNNIYCPRRRVVRPLRDSCTCSHLGRAKPLQISLNHIGRSSPWLTMKSKYALRSRQTSSLKNSRAKQNLSLQDKWKRSNSESKSLLNGSIRRQKSKKSGKTRQRKRILIK
ncbi:hypothetical protein FGO68_gene4392 [Halteria grandinella]|uniref:Uncharacterized protein n=1 Tax=Halteria grandinella TaxID=5974 RepID=A0A8J8T8M4_HALGN|nr:hypothetical protein FGO68_gene4392 [Halteria grandinella]